MPVVVGSISEAVAWWAVTSIVGNAADINRRDSRFSSENADEPTLAPRPLVCFLISLASLQLRIVLFHPVSSLLFGWTDDKRIQHISVGGGRWPLGPLDPPRRLLV